MTRERTKTVALVVTTVPLLVILFLLDLRYLGVTGALTNSEPWGFYRVTQEPVHRGGMVELGYLM